MNTQLLKDRLTIVIPCKNEGVNIYECLGFISKQRGIAGTRVIISDNSDDEESLRWIYQTESNYKYSLKIEVIKGGFPAQARLNGSKLVTTPYMLFLDADIMLFKQGLLETVVEYEKDLVTVPFETETGFNWIFRMFDITQRLSVFLGTPFAVGGFQLFKTESYQTYLNYVIEKTTSTSNTVNYKTPPTTDINSKNKLIKDLYSNVNLNKDKKTFNGKVKLN